jgi:hypothetical protein
LDEKKEEHKDMFSVIKKEKKEIKPELKSDVFDSFNFGELQPKKKPIVIFGEKKETNLDSLLGAIASSNIKTNTFNTVQNKVINTGMNINTNFNQQPTNTNFNNAFGNNNGFSNTNTFNQINTLNQANNNTGFNLGNTNNAFNNVNQGGNKLGNNPANDEFNLDFLNDNKKKTVQPTNNVNLDNFNFNFENNKNDKKNDKNGLDSLLNF